MYIVNKKQFLLLPEETLYTSYTPDYMEGLFIKGENVGENDFCYTNQIVELDLDDSNEDFHKRLDMSKDSNIKCKLHFNTYYRDGLFDEESYYAIWEKEDIEGLINRLQRTLEGK